MSLSILKEAQSSLSSLLEEPWFWNGVVDTIPALVFLLDHEQKVLWANRTVESWGLELHPKDQLVHGYVHPHCEDSSCYLADSLKKYSHNQAKKTVNEGDDPVLNRRIKLSIHPLKVEKHFLGSDGPFDLFVLQDITGNYARYHAEQRRDHFEAITSLVGGLAHEIRNPLAATKTCIQVLMQNYDQFDDLKRKRYLGKILEGADRLEGILNHALKERRVGVQSGDSVSIQTLLKRSQNLFEDEMERRGIQFSVDFPKTPIHILGNLTAAEEVLLNIISNAMDACQAGDRIGISCSADGNKTLIKVKDSGSGIDHENIALIFLPYFTTKPKGSGIGLAYANHLMKEMGGSIQIEGGNEGTTVSLLFRKASLSK